MINSQENNIYPCLLFENQAKEAADFYMDTFHNGKIVLEVAEFILFEIEGLRFKAINTSHPEHYSNPAVSFIVSFTNEEEIEKVWKKLKVGGIIILPLDAYEWSPKYAWLQDQFGISWHLIQSDSPASIHQKISPMFLFGEDNLGRAETASNFYLEVFKNSNRDPIERYEEDEFKDLVKQAPIYLNDYLIRVMDSSMEQPFDFSPGISLVVECETQKEIDYYWNAFAFGGQIGEAGWVKDKFGLWWQIVPKKLNEWIANPSINQKIVSELKQMTKIDLEKLASFT